MSSQIQSDSDHGAKDENNGQEDREPCDGSILFLPKHIGQGRKDERTGTQPDEVDRNRNRHAPGNDAARPKDMVTRNIAYHKADKPDGRKDRKKDKKSIKLSRFTLYF